MPISALTTNILIGVVTGFITSTFAPPGWGIIRKTMAERLKAGGEPINHDLQRACLRAILEATFFLCNTHLKRFAPNPKKGLLHHDEDVRCLSAIYIILDRKFREMCNPKHIPEEYVQIDTKLLLQPPLTDMEQIRKNLQEDVIRMLFQWQEDLPESLLKAIREGWEDNGRTFDWFDSVCLCFANILKTDQKVWAIFSSEILVENNAIIREDNESFDPTELSRQIFNNINAPLPIDPKLTLRQIYVPPSAYYWDNKAVKPKDGDDKKNAKKVDLINDLLVTLKKSSSPIVIHGQPGHGKTSTVRMLAYEMGAALLG